ncbi:MAG TPA: PilT/PilU family type 4a pilus ATPase [Candidatus Dormibacteraeota bacterium]|nr:PilT/PilU family type 4a pilus ATPase [Candidatus Dormibacteraeota bacterium]
MRVPRPAIAPLVDSLFERGASDLLLSAGAPPMLRVDGALTPAAAEPITAEELAGLVDELLSAAQRATLHERGAVDFSLGWDRHGRLRGNAFHQRGSVALALRAIAHSIPGLAELGLPAAVERLVDLPQGLILITGPAGSGKSTTQAAMIDALNRSRALHVITIEDPIEYLHRHQRCLIDQREVGVDTPSFAEALRSVLREDPDVLLVGEMRDLESIRMALSIAETGHLVIGTLHTSDASQAITRVVDAFPAEQQQQVRVQLSLSLAAVLHQQLLPRREGGRVAAVEVLIATPAVRSLVRENKLGQLRNVIATSAREGMQTLESSLSALVASGQVEHAVALSRSLHPAEVRAAG